MNKSEFISLIEQPETLGKDQITALKHIAADFPFFQCAQTLLTKALYNEHHYEFEKHLKHTSLMVPDRAVLFRYIHNLNDIAEAHSPVEQYARPTAINPVIEVQEEIPAKVVETTPEISETIPDKIEEPVEELIETVGIPESTPESELPVEITNEKPDETEGVLNEVPVAEVQEEIEQVIEPVAETEKTEEVAEELTVTADEIHSFSEWLKLQQGKKVTGLPITRPEQVPVETKEDEIKPEIEPESIQDQVEENSIPAEPPGTKNNINEFESILDKFIRDNPRISRPKAEFYNPVNMAKHSAEVDDELVTETLANVYYKQGHYKKAIRAYEKLCLIYPHKMTYFASLIQKIKTENKD